MMMTKFVGVAVCVLSLLLGCSDAASTTSPSSSSATYALSSVPDAVFFVGRWSGGIGTEDGWIWTFASDGSVTATDPVKSKTDSLKWSLSGSVLTMTFVTPKGKTNTEPFTAEVLDADHVKLGSTEFGSFFHIRRLLNENDPTAPGSPTLDEKFLATVWRGPIGTTNPERGADDWDFRPDGTLILPGSPSRGSDTWRLEGDKLKVSSKMGGGKMQTDTLPVRVFDANHLVIDVSTWGWGGGGKLLLARKAQSSATKPAAAQPGAKK